MLNPLTEHNNPYTEEGLHPDLIFNLSDLGFY